MKTVDEAVLEKAVKALEDFAYRGRCDNWSEALIALDAVLEQPDQRSGPEPSVAQLNAILDGLGAAPGARQSAREFLRVWIRDWTMHKLALAQQEQEPVAWRVHPFDYGIGSEGVYAMTQRPDQVKAWERKGWTVQQLYIRPPRRQIDQEPEAYKITGKLGDICHFKSSSVRKGDVVYTLSPRVEKEQEPMPRWKIDELMRDAGWQNSAIRQADLDKVEKVVRAVEQALKEKNHA